MIHTQLWIQCPEHLLTFTARSESVNVSNTLYSHMQQTHINTGCFVHLSLTVWWLQSSWWHLHDSGASVQIFWIWDSSRSFSRSSLNSPHSVTAHMEILRNSYISYFDAYFIIINLNLLEVTVYTVMKRITFCRIVFFFSSFKCILYISHCLSICAALANTFNLFISNCYFITSLSNVFMLNSMSVTDCICEAAVRGVAVQWCSHTKCC